LKCRTVNLFLTDPHLTLWKPLSIFHGIGPYINKVTFRKAVPTFSVEIHIFVNRLHFFATKAFMVSVHMHFIIFLRLRAIPCFIRKDKFSTSVFLSLPPKNIFNQLPDFCKLHEHLRKPPLCVCVCVCMYQFTLSKIIALSRDTDI
jgi:hypothetical protein